MRIATTASIALLALSTAALAQVASSPTGSQTQNNAQGSNMSGPDTMGTMADNSAAPDNGATPPGN